MQTFTEFLLEMDIPTSSAAGLGGLDNEKWSHQYKAGNAERMVNDGAEYLMDYIQQLIEPAKEQVYQKLYERFDQIGDYQQGVKFARFMLQMELERAMSRKR